MGIDIGDLSSVLLASIPPEQANYAQRVGRAGRTDGNAFVVAIANNRPHDRVFWATPEAMIAGPIRAPGVFLDASAILYRQFTGFSLDRWVASGIGSEAIPNTLGPVLETLAIDPRPQDRFPFTWLTFIDRNRSVLIGDFLGLFKSELSDESQAQIRRFVEGGEVEGGVAWRVLDEFEAEQRRRRDLDRERRQVRGRITTRKKDPRLPSMCLQLSTELAHRPGQPPCRPGTS
jgi:DEAD/DEAH box helicase domain-containing protein